MNISSGLLKNKNSSSLRQLHTCEFRVSGRKSQVQSESFRGFLLEVRAETFWLFEKKQRRNGKNWSSLPDGVQRPVKARLIFIYWFTQSAQEAFLSPHLFVRLSPAVEKIRSLLRIEAFAGLKHDPHIVHSSSGARHDEELSSDLERVQRTHWHVETRLTWLCPPGRYAPQVSSTQTGCVGFSWLQEKNKCLR